MEEVSQRERLAAEHRNLRRRVKVFQDEFAPHRALNEEYQRSQQRIAEILGPDDQGIVGTKGGRTA